MPKLKSDKTSVDNDDMWILLLSTVRYSLGRRTSMPYHAHRLVMKYKKFLDKDMLKQIYDEIKRELDIHYKSENTKWLGDKCDVDEWEKFARDLVLQ